MPYPNYTNEEKHIHETYAHFNERKLIEKYEATLYKAAKEIYNLLSVTESEKNWIENKVNKWLEK